MEILRNQVIPIEKWQEAYALSDFASPFQGPDYFNYLSKNATITAEAFAVSRHIQIKAIIVVTIFKGNGLKGYLARRGIIFGGPLIFNATNEELSFLLLHVAKILKKKLIYLETRNSFDYSEYKKSFEAIGWDYLNFLNIHLDLKNRSLEEIISSFNYSRRREIKQSLKNGALYDSCDSLDDINAIYKILKSTYRERVKRPLPDLEFFTGLFTNKILFAYKVIHNSTIIGGIFCLKTNNKGLYTFYYCGLRDYHKRIFPSHLAILAAIEYASKEKIGIIDFMGAGKPGSNYGVRQYKLEFGGSLVEHGRFIKILNPFMFNLGKFGLKILSKIK